MSYLIATSMFANWCKEGFSEAYVRAIAARAGCYVQRRFDDVDRIDGDIRSYSDEGRFPSAPLEFQLKASTTADVQDDAVIYDLSAAAHNRLCARQSSAPSILILVVMPQRLDDWLLESEEDLLLRRAAYWLSLEGREPTANANSKRIRIPRDNQLTVDSLYRIMRLVAEDEFPQ